MFVFDFAKSELLFEREFNDEIYLFSWEADSLFVALAFNTKKKQKFVILEVLNTFEQAAHFDVKENILAMDFDHFDRKFMIS